LPPDVLPQGAGIVGAVGTQPRDFASKAVVNFSGHWPADNRNPTQPPILIMSGVVPKSPHRHVVMPMVLLDKGERLFLGYGPKLWHRIHLVLSGVTGWRLYLI
jgi:hypothetical protein